MAFSVSSERHRDTQSRMLLEPEGFTPKITCLVKARDRTPNGSMPSGCANHYTIALLLKPVTPTSPSFTQTIQARCTLTKARHHHQYNTPSKRHYNSTSNWANPFQCYRQSLKLNFIFSHWNLISSSVTPSQLHHRSIKVIIRPEAYKF